LRGYDMYKFRVCDESRERRILGVVAPCYVPNCESFTSLSNSVETWIASLTLYRQELATNA